MRNAIWVLLILTAFQCYLGSVCKTNGMGEERKADAYIPMTTLAPPEGNTTFLGGASWCVARPGSSPTELQIALDWSCGVGGADCRPIQPGGACYEPNTLVSHASYSFNSYYQQNGNSDIACYFGGTAALTHNDPSYEKCAFASSESLRSSGTYCLSRFSRWKIVKFFWCLSIWEGDEWAEEMRRIGNKLMTIRLMLIFFFVSKSCCL